MSSQSPQRPNHIESDDAWYDRTLDMAELWLTRAGDYTLDLRDFWWTPEQPYLTETCCLCDRPIPGHRNDADRRSQWLSESDADGSSHGGHRFRAHPEVAVQRQRRDGTTRQTAVHAWICNGCLVSKRREFAESARETTRGFYESQFSNLRAQRRGLGGEATADSVEMHDAINADAADSRQPTVTITQLIAEASDVAGELRVLEFRGRAAMVKRLVDARDGAAKAHETVRQLREAVKAHDATALAKLDPAMAALQTARIALSSKLAESKTALDEHSDAE